MNIVINPDLQAYIDPLTPEEHDALERSLLAEGCRDALVLWGEVLVDGHNRYGICQKHGLPFQTVQNPRFRTIEDVHLWMIDQHLGRRSVSDFQRGTLALRKREILAARLAQARTAVLEAGAAESSATSDDDTAATSGAGPTDAPWDSPDGLGAASAEGASPEPALSASAAAAEAAALEGREALARAARLSANQVSLIEKIQKLATPELVAAVKSGALSLSAAAAVATLPAEEQVAAANAGAAELKSAARRVRDAKRKPRAEEAAAPEADEAPSAPAQAAPTDLDLPTDLPTLQQRVTELTAENEALKAEIAMLKKRYAL